MGAKRVTGLYTFASTSNTDAVSIRQATRIVARKRTRLNKIPTEPLNVTKKQNADTQAAVVKRNVKSIDAAVRRYVNNLKILNNTGHIPPLSREFSKTGFNTSASTTPFDYVPFMAFNSGLIAMPPNLSRSPLRLRLGGMARDPAPERVWKISLAGSTDISLNRILSWTISGGTYATTGDSTTFVNRDLLSSNTTLTDSAKEFAVDSNETNRRYRVTALTVLEIEPSSSTILGISHFQIYTYFKVGKTKDLAMADKKIRGYLRQLREINYA